MAITQDVLAHTSRWMAAFALEWHEEIPQRVHSGAFAADGTHEWHPDFQGWIGLRRNTDGRYRLTQAMRRLRKKSVREYEVAYRMIVLGEPIEQTTTWLNTRAVKNGKPERYKVSDTQVIIVSAVDKLLAWY